MTIGWIVIFPKKLEFTLQNLELGLCELINNKSKIQIKLFQIYVTLIVDELNNSLEKFSMKVKTFQFIFFSKKF